MDYNTALSLLSCTPPPLSHLTMRRIHCHLATSLAIVTCLLGLKATPAAGESPWETIKPYFAVPAEYAGEFGDYRSPLIFSDGSKVQNAQDWQRRRSEILQTWTEHLGEWPPFLDAPHFETLESKSFASHDQHKIEFEWLPGVTTTAYLLVPKTPGPHPAVVTVYYEPETAIGLGKEDRDFAVQLVKRGFVTLSLGTARTTNNKTYSLYYPSIEKAEIEPLSTLAYAAANAWYLLASRDDVDPGRIGIVGHSYGGKWAMFASCLFDRFACAAWSDPGIVFDETRSSINYWEPWYLGYHPKPWRKRGLITPENPAQGTYLELVAEGRDLHELHALMAPRPFLVSGGAEDPAKRWVPLNHSIQVNELLGATDRVAMSNRPDHSPNPESNEVIYSFFEHFLSPQKVAK